jgi:hypothetical protein
VSVIHCLFLEESDEDVPSFAETLLETCDMNGWQRFSSWFYHCGRTQCHYLPSMWQNMPCRVVRGPRSDFQSALSRLAMHFSVQQLDVPSGRLFLEKQRDVLHSANNTPRGDAALASR